MAGWEQIRMLRRLEEDLDKLGFKFDKPKHSDWSQMSTAVSITPKDKESLPIYCRDAELYIGSLEGLEHWLQGVRWAREYDMMLRLSDDKKRARKEQDERNRQLMRTIKNGEIAEGIEQ